MGITLVCAPKTEQHGEENHDNVDENLDTKGDVDLDNWRIRCDSRVRISKHFHDGAIRHNAMLQTTT